MSIWGRHDSEPTAGEAHESQGEAHGTQEAAAEHEAGEHEAGEHEAGEPAPAFWRAQGQTPAPLERDPADAPPPDYEHVPAGGGPAGGEPAGTDAPGPVVTGMVMDGETAAKDPALTGMHGDQARTREDQAGMHDAAGGPAATGVQEPTGEVAREPVVNEAQEPTASEPAVTEAPEPATGAGEPAMTPAHEPAVAAAQAVAHDSEITAQRWSEILVAFVDDPRGSVTMATDAVDEAIDEFVNLVRARQRDLASTWQGAETGTEQLRTALLGYRKLWHQVRQLDLGGKTGL